MSFTPKIWNSNDILSILNLNRLEEAVAEMGNYTPTVWAVGDKITAEKMNKLEQGIAEGGGGSSDFSTAEVTVVNNDEGSYIEMPICLEADEYDPARIGFAHIDDYATGTFTVPLYKGVCVILITEATVSYSVSGNIEDLGSGYLYITGDCTITIEAEAEGSKK